MKYKFGDIVMYGLAVGVVIHARHARKYNYYCVVFSEPEFSSNDWNDYLVEYEVIREDKLSQ